MFGLDGWRFMFLMQGLPAILLGICCWFYLTDRPKDAAAYAARAKLVTKRNGYRTCRNRQTVSLSPSQSSDTTARPRACLRLFRHCLRPLCCGFFLPTIIAGFQQTYNTNYSVIEQGFIVAVPYVFGAIAMYFWARHGDRTRERVWHVALPAIIGGIAIPVALYLQSPFTTMIAVTICAMGICSALPTFWPLPTTFLTGAAAAGGIALINSLGNLAGFVGPYVTGWLTDLTGSPKAGLWVVGAFMVAAGLTALSLKAAPVPDSGPAAETDSMRT